MQKRINKLRRLLKREFPSLDGLLIRNPFNIYYLTQIKNLEGYLLISSSENILFTDFRYYEEAKKKLPHFFKIKMLSKEWLKSILKEAKRNKIKNIGIETKSITASEYEAIKSHAVSLGLKPAGAAAAVEKLRAIKDKTEIACIKQAAKITQEAFEYAESIIYAGLSEKYIDIEIERFLKIKADLKLAFSPIVASGVNTACPHHSPGAQKIAEKDIVLVDIGARFNGYCSDLTRIFVLSKMPLYVRRLFDIMRKAKELAIKKIKAGAKIADIDKAARSYIEKKGQGKRFLHSLGHGVGLEVHEAPIINSRSTDILKENMIITIEPGIYVKNRFGVREENMILVKPNGAEVIA